MKKILTAAQMKYADNYTSEVLRMPSIVLMERAAMGACDAIVDLFPKDTRVSVICGVGNNGGDGMAIARILTQRGLPVKWCLVGDKNKLSESAGIQYEILINYGIEESSFNECVECDLLVDAIFGVGLSRNLNKEYRGIVDKINSLDAKKLAVDIPTGINATTGAVMGAAVKCDYTVTFAYEKLGHHLHNGRDYCGRVIIKIIGITEQSLPKSQKFVTAYERADLLPLLPLRTSDSHKGTYGRVLVIAGTKDMSGAAYMAARAAYISGAGLVKIYTEECNRVILQQLLPEAMLSTYEGEYDPISLSKELSWATTIIIGPGMGLSEEKQRLLSFVFENSMVPMIIDADALTILSRDLSLFESIRGNAIITPHIGEMARLTGEQVFDVLSDLPNVASGFAKRYGVVCVLKSACTLVATPTGEVFLNLYGNNGMSTGGSGDVLGGIISGLVAQKSDPVKAAILGVAIHSLAGDAAKEEVGAYSLIAQDILRGTVKVLKELEEESGQ